ncbi:MAG: hypothetical protein QMD66_03465 [Actinomycetota bacterium]|nr:hypothetical protein [Actinomycetota bacterium]
MVLYPPHWGVGGQRCNLISKENVSISGTAGGTPRLQHRPRENRSPDLLPKLLKYVDRR